MKQELTRFLSFFSLYSLKKKVLAIIFIELLVIAILLINGIEKFFPKYSVTPIQRYEVVYHPSGTLKHFYELKSNTVMHENNSSFQLDEPATYTITKDDLNERYEYSVKKPSDTFRILTLGDSFTFGHYVSTYRNWPEQLEDLMKKNCTQYKNYEVINMGVPGYDISYAVERFKIRGEKYNPDLILWILKDDDFSEVNDVTFDLSMKYKAEMIKSGEYQKSIANGIYFPHSMKAQKEFNKKFGEDKVLAMQKEFLATFYTFYKNPLVYLTLSDTTMRRKKLIESITGERGNTYFEQLFPFDQYPDTHPNVKGHQQIAQNVFAYLKDNNLIACEKSR